MEARAGNGVGCRALLVVFCSNASAVAYIISMVCIDPGDRKVFMYYYTKIANSSISRVIRGLPAYSHSIVPGGLLVISYTTRLIWGTSLMMRFDMCASTS